MLTTDSSKGWLWFSYVKTTFIAALLQCMQFPNSMYKSTFIVSFIVTLLQHICVRNFLERFLLQLYCGIWTCCMPNEGSNLLWLYCTFIAALLQLLLFGNPIPRWHLCYNFIAILLQLYCSFCCLVLCCEVVRFILTLLQLYCSFIAAFVVW